MTVSFSLLIVPLALITRAQPNGRRALWVLALVLFAVSATHLGSFHSGTDSWWMQLLGHHAAIPLAFAILYQNYRFALGDLFLKQALTLLAIVTVTLASLLAGIAVLLGRLRSAPDARAEQVAIGLGARLGNGVLLVTLAWLVLGGAGASDTARVTFALLLAALIGASVVSLAGHPERVVIGYKA